MFLKVTLSSLLIVGCFLTFNHAGRPHYTKHENSLTEGSGKSFSDFTYEIEKSFKELTQNSEWIYHLVSIIKSGFENGFQTITSWPVDLILRVEFLVMADGSHFVFPPSENHEKEKQYKAVAKAVSQILMNVRYMERVDRVLKNATKRLVSEDHGQFHYKDQQKSPEKIFGSLLQEYLDIVNHEMRADKVLQDEYRKRMGEAREIVERDPTMYGPLDKIWGEYSNTKYARVEEIKKFFQGKETFYRAMANKVFMKKSVKHFSMVFRPLQHHRYLLARALIQKAIVSPSYETKINGVYHQALTKAGEVGMKGDYEYNEIRDTLFNYLEKALESDPTFYEEIKGTMKQVEKTSAYDADMYIDFSIL